MEDMNIKEAFKYEASAMLLMPNQIPCGSLISWLKRKKGWGARFLSVERHSSVDLQLLSQRKRLEEWLGSLLARMGSSTARTDLEPSWILWGSRANAMKERRNGKRGSWIEEERAKFIIGWNNKALKTWGITIRMTPHGTVLCHLIGGLSPIRV